MGEFAIGQGVPRFEDPRLLRGGGQYVDDFVLPGMAFGHVLRSPHAHAKIKSIDTSKAKAAPGVLCVLTGEDWIKSGWGDLPVPGTHKRRDGSPMYKPRYPALVKDRVRCVGDYVAFVVAETKNQAADAAELIEVDYEPLPAVARHRRGREARRHARLGGLRGQHLLHAIHGDKAKTEAAFARAAHVVKQHLVINRVTAARWSRAARSATTTPIDDRYTIYTTLQRAHPYRAELAKRVLKVPEHKVRVIAGDVGGSFGMKSAIYNEVAARAAGLEADGPAGEMDEHALGGVPVRREGARQRHRRRARARQGRHLPRLPRDVERQRRRLSAIRLPAYTRNLGTLAGVYRTPAMHVEVDRGVHPHPADAALSRQRTAGGGLCDRAHGRSRRRATEHRSGGTAPKELHSARGDAVQDRPHLHLRLRRVREGHGHRAEARRRRRLREARAPNREARQAARPRHVQHHRARGGGGPRGRRNPLRPRRHGHDVLGLDQPGPGPRDGVQAGRRRQLGIHPNDIEYIQGDTDKVFFGEGTGGSRSATMSGSAFHNAAEKVIEKAKAIAAHMLKVDADDVKFEEGIFSSAKTNQTMTIKEVAQDAVEPGETAEEHGGRAVRHRGLQGRRRELPERRARLRGRDRSRRPARSRSCDTAWSTMSAP